MLSVENIAQCFVRGGPAKVERCCLLRTCSLLRTSLSIRGRITNSISFWCACVYMCADVCVFVCVFAWESVCVCVSVREKTSRDLRRPFTNKVSFWCVCVRVRVHVAPEYRYTRMNESCHV